MSCRSYKLLPAHGTLAQSFPWRQDPAEPFDKSSSSWGNNAGFVQGCAKVREAQKMNECSEPPGILVRQGGAEALPARWGRKNTELVLPRMKPECTESA